MDRIVSYWNNRAKSYSENTVEELRSSAFENWKEVLGEQLQAHFSLPLGKLRALDVGTGPGFMGIVLASLGLKVTGADSSSRMLERARQNAREQNVEVTFVQTDAVQPELPADHFDVLVCRNLTWDLPDPVAAYKAWQSLLKPGGLLLIFDANWYRYLFDAQKQKEYDADRVRVKDLKLRDFNLETPQTGVDFHEMEDIARNLPLSATLRPAWDLEVLRGIGYGEVCADPDIWKRVWSEEEKINYASTPMFLIRAVKS